MTGKMNGQFRHQSLKETEAAVNGKALYLAIIFYMSHDPQQVTGISQTMCRAAPWKHM
jgi:hypothetical protein